MVEYILLSVSLFCVLAWSARVIKKQVKLLTQEERLMSLKPICVKCQRFYRPKKNGFTFIEGMPMCNGAAAGLAEPENWLPYKLWRGDLWECQGCNNLIVVGTGQAPIDEHYTSTFARNKLAIEVALQKPLLQINDC